MNWRNILLTAGIVILLMAIGFMVYAAFQAPRWEEISTKQYGDIGSYTLDAWEEPEALSYEPKYDEAVEMLDDAGIELSGDYLIVVDISEQREYIYETGGTFVDMYTVATGADSVYVPASTDSGSDVAELEDGQDQGVYQDRSMGPSIWRVVSRVESGLAPLYGARLMMLDRLYKGKWIKTNVALHGTDTPEMLGTPESLGCVYHSNVDIIALYDLIDIGTYVVAVE
jgi:hypothetical protein